MSSTLLALATREAGKIARSKLKSPHTTGREGRARVGAELDDVITAYESDSSVPHGDLDHDAVTKVFGRDSRGCVRDIGIVSKMAIKYSAPYKRALEEEHECNSHLQTEVKRLEDQLCIRRELDELKQTLTQGGTKVRPSTYHGLG